MTVILYTTNVHMSIAVAVITEEATGHDKENLIIIIITYAYFYMCM